MTASNKLALFADSLSSSGKISDLTSSITGTVTIAKGGTGLSAVGANNYILRSNGTSWVASPIVQGTVTSIQVANANGFYSSGQTNVAGAVAVTMNVNVYGILKGNGTGLVSAVSGTDYIPPLVSTTNFTTASMTISGTLTFRGSTSGSVTLSLPGPRAYVFRNNVYNSGTSSYVTATPGYTVTGTFFDSSATIAPLVMAQSSSIGIGETFVGTIYEISPAGNISYYRASGVASGSVTTTTTSLNPTPSTSTITVVALSDAGASSVARFAVSQTVPIGTYQIVTSFSNPIESGQFYYQNDRFILRRVS